MFITFKYSCIQVTNNPTQLIVNQTTSHVLKVPLLVSVYVCKYIWVYVYKYVRLIGDLWVWDCVILTWSCFHFIFKYVTQSLKHVIFLCYHFFVVFMLCSSEQGVGVESFFVRHNPFKLNKETLNVILMKNTNLSITWYNNLKPWSELIFVIFNRL